MSKKSKKIEEELRRQNERKRRKNHLICGLILGSIIGFAIGYACRKHLSNDAKKRILEKDFFRARLSEIKSKLHHLSGHLEDIEPLNQEIEDAIHQV